MFRGQICSKIIFEDLLFARNYSRNQKYSREHNLWTNEGRWEEGRGYENEWINKWMDE